MHLTVIKPTSEVTSLDLARLPVWQLRMEVAANSSGDGKASLCVGIRYLTGGTQDGTAFVQILAINCKCQATDLAPVIKIGFPQDRTAAKERLRESMKVLYNASMPAKDVEEVLPKTGLLIDTYFNIRDALYGKSPALENLGPVASGEAEGYRWAITRQRFESWVVEKVAEEPPVLGPGWVDGEKTIPPPPGSGKGKGHGRSAAVE